MDQTKKLESTPQGSAPRGAEIQDISQHPNTKHKIRLKETKYPILRSVCTALDLPIIDASEAPSSSESEKNNNNNHNNDNNNNYEDDWTIWWMDNPGKCSRTNMKQLRPTQKINHFPSMSEITLKNHLARNLNRMMFLFGDEAYGFYPRSFVYPKDQEKLESYLHETNKERGTFIVKPANHCEGRGIFLTNEIGRLFCDDQDKNSGETLLHNCVIQEYIENPLLIDQHKFDIRLYVLISSCNPLRVYLHKEGLVRFTTQQVKKILLCS